jgi:hypothetical protein
MLPWRTGVRSVRDGPTVLQRTRKAIRATSVGLWAKKDHERSSHDPSMLVGRVPDPGPADVPSKVF